MTVRILCLCQRRLGAAIMTAAVALALSACSSSNQGTTASTPIATATSQGSVSAASAASATRFAAYAESIPTTPPNTQCALDTVNAKPAADAVPLAAGSDVVFAGWAGNGQGQAANGFLFVLKGEQAYAAPIQTNVARADVVKFLNSANMSNSGFGLSASLAGIAAGNYSLYIADPTNTANVCDTRRSITVQ